MLGQHLDVGELALERQRVVVLATGILLPADASPLYVILLEADHVNVVSGALPIGLVKAVGRLCSRPDLHASAVERVQISGNVHDIEDGLRPGFPIKHLEEEPVCFALCVGIGLAKQVILLLVDQVGRVQVAGLEVAIELQQVLLVDEVGQLRFHILVQVVVEF